MTLANGVRIVCMPTDSGDGPARNVAAIQLWVAAGTADERAGEHGAAHFCEHMVFRPWGPGPDENLASCIEARGGEVNAYTAYDETVYYATAAARELHFVLDALADAVLEPRFDAEAVERERGVILEEISSYEDDAGAVVADASAAQLFPAHAYGRPILGTGSELRTLDARRLRAFHRRNYVGRRLTLVVVGPVSRREVHAWARRRLGAQPAGRSAKLPRRWPRTPEGAARVVALPGVEAELRVAWSGPGLVHEDAVALDLLGVVLGQGDASRLSSTLRRSRGLAHDAHAGLMIGAQASSFVMSASASVEQAEPCLAGMLELRADLERRPPRAAEIDAARAMLRATLVYRRETVGGQAHALGYYACVGRDSEMERDYFARLETLGVDDLLRVAKRHLDPARAQICCGLPRASFDAAARRRFTRRATSLLREAMEIERAPVSARVRWRKAGALRSCVVGEGLRVVALPDARVPVAAAWLGWLGGQRAEPESVAGLGQLTARTLGRANEERSSLGLARWLDQRAAALDGFFGRLASGLQFESTAEHFESLLEIAMLTAARPSFDGIDLEREREATLDELRAESEDAGSVCIGRALSSLYGAHHPYARSLRGRAKVVREASPERLHHFWAQRRPGQAVLAIAGDVDLDRLVRVVADGMRAWPKAPDQVDPWPEAKWPKRSGQSRHARRKGTAQAQICLAYRGLPEGHPEQATLELMVEILGAQTGPLFAALREREGLVYHVGVASTAGLGAGHLVVHAASSMARFDRTRVALLQTLADFAETGPSPESFERGRATLLGHLERSWQRRGRIAGQLAIHTLLGQEARSAWDWPQQVAAVTPAGLRDFARRCLSAAPVRSTVVPSD